IRHIHLHISRVIQTAGQGLEGDRDGNLVTLEEGHDRHPPRLFGRSVDRQRYSVSGNDYASTGELQYPIRPRRSNRRLGDKIDYFPGSWQGVLMQERSEALEVLLHFLLLIFGKPFAEESPRGWVTALVCDGCVLRLSIRAE